MTQEELQALWDQAEPETAPTQELSQEELQSMWEQAAPEGVGMFESGLRGVGEGLSMGFIDELAGAVGTPFAQLSGDAPEGESWKDTYQSIRDIVRQQQEQAKADNPKTFGVGEVAGALVPTPGLALRGAKTLTEAVGKGAAYGATYGAGKADELQDVPQEMLTGAAYGAGGAGVASAAGRMLSGTGGAMLKEGNKIAPRTPKAPPKGPDVIPGSKYAVGGPSAKPTVTPGYTRVESFERKLPEPKAPPGIGELIGKQIGAQKTGDWLAAGAGGVVAGPAGAVAAVAGKKVLQQGWRNLPRGSRGWLSGQLQTNGKRFSKWGQQLQNAEQRGGNALVATHYVLQQQDPDYRDLWQELEEEQKKLDNE